MPRIIHNIAVFMMIMALSVSAQSRQGIVRISPFTGSGIPPSELATLERLVASHVAELRLFRVIDDTGREMALGETEIALSLGYQSNQLMPLTADIILSGHLGRIGDLYVFSLENTRVSSGEKISVSDTGFSINDIVLRTRSLTRSLFGKVDVADSSQSGSFLQTGTLPQTGNQGIVLPPETKPSVPAVSDSTAIPMPALPDNNYIQNPSLTQIAGTWRGDRGLETVRLFPGGTGMAVLSGGGSMRLRIDLEGDSILISQDQPNDAAMYRGPSINFEIATRIARLARPMKWKFRLSADGLSLIGVKESVLVSGTSTTLTVDNDYIREAAWSRISR